MGSPVSETPAVAAKDACIVLTATIEAHDPSMLRPWGRKDTAQRLEDYKRALVRWLTEQGAVSNLVFAENSGYPLDELEEIVSRHRNSGKRVHFVSHQTTGYTRARGRSYGELDLLAHARPAVERYEHIVKVNGRVFIANFDELFSRLAADADVVGALRHNLTWLDTTFVVFRTQFFFDEILPAAVEAVNDEARDYIERVLAKGVLRGVAADRRWYPFPCEPRIAGRRALDNERYPSNLLRARLIDAFAWGFYRAFDTTSGRNRSHSLDRWHGRSDEAG